MKVVTIDSRTGTEFTTETRTDWAGLVESLLEQNTGRQGGSRAELEPGGRGVVVTDPDGHWRSIRPVEGCDPGSGGVE